MAPRVVLVGNFQPDEQESMLRFERALADGLAARGTAVEVCRPSPRFVRAIKRYRYGGVPKYLGYLDKYVVFPRELRRRVRQDDGSTVYHIVDHANAVYARALRDAPVVVTCHDLLQIRSALGEIPLNRLSRSGQKFQLWILDSLKALGCVACVSQKTRDDLLRLTALPAASAQVIPMGLNFPYRRLAAEEATALLNAALRRQGVRWPGNAAAPVPFLFSIGGAQWYKNRTGLIRIFGALRAKLPSLRALLYAGPAFDLEQTQLIAQLGLGDAIVHVSKLSNDEVAAAYSLADGLLFPSWEEGFGWPVAEAQACGCPVFASNRAPMTEVGGDAGRYFDPADPEQAASVIAEGLALPDPLRTAGLERARRWDTGLMLDAYSELYDAMRKNAAHRSA